MFLIHTGPFLPIKSFQVCQVSLNCTNELLSTIISHFPFVKFIPEECPFIPIGMYVKGRCLLICEPNTGASCRGAKVPPCSGHMTSRLKYLPTFTSSYQQLCYIKSWKFTEAGWSSFVHCPNYHPASIAYCVRLLLKFLQDLWCTGSKYNLPDFYTWSIRFYQMTGNISRGIFYTKY